MCSCYPRQDLQGNPETQILKRGALSSHMPPEMLTCWKRRETFREHRCFCRTWRHSIDRHTVCSVRRQAVDILHLPETKK